MQQNGRKPGAEGLLRNEIFQKCSRAIEQLCTGYLTAAEYREVQDTLARASRAAGLCSIQAAQNERPCHLTVHVGVIYGR